MRNDDLSVIAAGACADGVLDALDNEQRVVVLRIGRAVVRDVVPGLYRRTRIMMAQNGIHLRAAI